jgi:hypothetical protein
MPDVTYNYVYYSASKQRQNPRVGGGFTLITSTTLSGPAAGKPLVVAPLPQYQVVNGVTYNFSYGTVVGCVQDGTDPTTLQCLSPPVGLIAGPGPLSVLAVYLRPPVGGPSFEVTIDAFDETTGALFDDDFVSVAPDPTGQVTKNANKYGTVDTAHTAETITAISPTSPTKVNFSKWVKLGPPAEHFKNLQLATGLRQSFIALAFYDAPPPSPPPSPGQVTCTNELDNLNQLILAELTPFLAQEWTDYQTRLHNCVNQGFLPKGKVDSAIQQYNELLKTKHNTPPPMKP